MKIIVPVGMVLALAIGVAAGWFGAMKKLGGHATNTSADLSQAALFTLDQKTYGLQDLPPDIRNVLTEGQASAFERTEASLKEFALRLALAKTKDPAVTIDKLPQLQELLTSSPPSDAELQKFYEENKQRLPPNVTFEQVKSQLSQFMIRQKTMEGVQGELTKLESAGRLKILLPEPVTAPVNLDLVAYPTRGPAGAAMTLVEASDYLCPHCREMQPEVEALIKELGDKLRFVQVNYALRPDGLSGALARGAFCAHRQSPDIFWKYHELGFKVSGDEVMKDDRANDKAVVANVAREAGASEEQFAACFDSPEASNFVQTTVSKMGQAGVSGTPTFFLNNRKIRLHGPLKDIVKNAMAGG